MLDKISKNNLFDSIENIKGIGPKTLKWLEKLCGNRIIDLLLTIPRNFKRRKHLLKITNDHLKQSLNSNREDSSKNTINNESLIKDKKIEY